MSYCRWSSEDFWCDVYVYADCRGGWTTHVAANRLRPVRPMPEPPDYGDIHDIEALVARQREVLAIVHASPRNPIGLEFDGQTFNDPTPGACADRLETLRAAGYRVPQYAIDNLRDEAAEA